MISELGGIRILAASHPHGYGALYQLQEHFGPELLIQKEDLEWTKAMRVTLPYDEVFEIRPGLTLYHTGGPLRGAFHPVRRGSQSGLRGRFAEDRFRSGWQRPADILPQGLP